MRRLIFDNYQRCLGPLIKRGETNILSYVSIRWPNPFQLSFGIGLQRARHTICFVYYSSLVLCILVVWVGLMAESEDILIETEAKSCLCIVAYSCCWLLVSSNFVGLKHQLQVVCFFVCKFNWLCNILIGDCCCFFNRKFKFGGTKTPIASCCFFCKINLSCNNSFFFCVFNVLFMGGGSMKSSN